MIKITDVNVLKRLKLIVYFRRDYLYWIVVLVRIGQDSIDRWKIQIGDIIKRLC